MPPHLLPLLAFIGLVICTTSGAAERLLAGRVLRVIDGDSLVLEVRSSQYSIELAGIDAPEINQPWGPAAAEGLYAALTGRFVLVHRAGVADGGKVVGRVMFEDRDIALDQLHGGLAWSTVGAPTEPADPDHPYNIAERQARAAQRGLWSDAQPIPPWEWRRPHRRGGY